MTSNTAISNSIIWKLITFLSSSVSCHIGSKKCNDIKILVIADFPEGFNFTKVKDEENLYQIENNGILSQGNILNCTCCALKIHVTHPNHENLTLETLCKMSI